MRAMGVVRNWMPFGGTGRLAAEARAHAPILPVLSRQLRDASGEMSREVENICLEFQAIAGQAKGSVELVSALLDDRAAEQNAGNIIQDCRATMAALIDRIEKGTALYERAIGQIEAMHATASQVFQILEEVDRAAFGNKLVALNAKIEAVHMGDRGAAFEVVAEQISLQALRSSELTEQVGTILKSVTGTMSAAAAEMKQLAELDRGEAEKSRRAVEDALRSLEAASAKMHSVLDQSGETGARLVDSIGKAVMSLQFQDRLSQRIGHVVDSLEAMARAFSEPESNAPARSAQEVHRSLVGSYTMESERAAHEASAAATRESGAQGGEVELF